MTQRFGAHPAVAGWLLSNEMPLYGGETDADSAWAWAELLVQAVRAGGGRQPVSTGDGAWGIETTGHDNGFRLRRLANVVDFVGPHVYHLENDEWRQLLSPAFACELSHFGPPVVLEEIGATSAFACDDNIAAYYRHALHTSLLAGATGWLGWNNTDYDLVDADPYRHHPFELRFGLTDAQGRPKPALAEFAAFRATLDEIAVAGCTRAPAGAAIVVSSHFEVDYPFADPAARPPMRDVLLQAYVSARAADLGPALVREVDGIPAAELLILPSTQALNGPGWRALHERAEAGAVVYVSYFAGHVRWHRGLWHPDLDGFFGVRHRLRYGLVDAIEEDEVVWRVERAFGDLEPGDHLRFGVAGNEHGRAWLPVEPDGAEVLATDSSGRPALLERRVGRGAIVLATYPVEYLAASRANANPDDVVRLYRALAARAGCEPPVRVARPDVHVDRTIGEDGTVLAWFVSYADDALDVHPLLAAGHTLLDRDTGAPLETVPLGPRGVAIAELARVPAPHPHDGARPARAVRPRTRTARE
jgi:endo-1,4-beta-mannosidase